MEDMVVKPPQNPVASSNRAAGDKASVRSESAAITPIQKHPRRLAAIVPCGQSSDQRWNTTLRP